jgi:hypothetical protein
MDAKVQSESCARESMTRHLFKAQSHFGALLSVDKLRIQLLAKCIELFHQE